MSVSKEKESLFTDKYSEIEECPIDLENLEADDKEIFDIENSICEEKNIEINGIFINSSGEIEIKDTAVYPFSDPLRQYFEEIGRMPMLTAEEERNLAERINQGDMEAKEQLFNSNLRLVVGISRKYMYRGLSLIELILEGSRGLIQAVEKYNNTKEYNFSSCATWWIKEAITRALPDGYIHIPPHLREHINGNDSL